MLQLIAVTLDADGIFCPKGGGGGYEEQNVMLWTSLLSVRQ